MSSTVKRRPAAAIAAGFIVVASVVGMDPGGWFPFSTAKWHAVLLAVVVAAWAVVSTVSTRPVDVPRWFVATWAALLLVLLLASIVGREPLYAWIGTPERRLGWLTWLLFGLCCWIGTRLNSTTDRRIVARIVVVSTAAVGIYSLVELVFGAPIAVDTVGQRIGATYGSSAFLGAALCLLLPVSAAEAFDRSEHATWRVVGGGATALGVIALFASGTRAAFVGIGVATIVVAIAALRRGQLHHLGGRRTVVIASIGVAAVAVVVTVSSLLGSSTTDRLESNARRVVDVTASSRLDEWSVGVRIVGAHPVLGVGPEGYRTALADGITADYERSYGRDVIPDRAHNGVIDVAAAGGVVAGVLYAVLLGGAVVVAWRRLPTGPTLAGVGVAVIAYATQQMFLFPVSVIDPIFWLFVGIIIARPAGAISPHPEPSRSATVRRGVAVVGVAAVLAVTISAVLDISADRLAKRASAESGATASTGDAGSAAAFAARAARLRPDILRYYMLDDRLQPTSITGINTALATLDRASAVSPLDPVVRRRHAERLLDLAIATGDPGDSTAAIAAWVDLASDANCYRCHLGLGYAYALSGDTDDAVVAFERAAQLARAGDTEAADAVAALTQTKPRQP